MFRNFCKPEGGKMFCIFRMFIHFAIKGECFFSLLIYLFKMIFQKKKMQGINRVVRKNKLMKL